VTADSWRIGRLESGRTVVERVLFRGHPMVRALHPTTIEVTTEEHLSERGDCIIGVAASKGCADLAGETKDALRDDDSKVTIRVLVGRESFEVRARGDSRLLLTHPSDIVVRRSTFINERTVAVKAEFAAMDMPRSLVETLKDDHTMGVIEIEVTRT
jgi:hypothetical protein